MVPVCRVDGTIMSLQFIALDGGKKFLAGGATGGGSYVIGEPSTPGPLCIGEGFATSASIHEATGYAVVVAFSASNLEPVAKLWRAQAPNRAVVLCADDDYKTEGNPGLAHAIEAARAIKAVLAVPIFGVDRPDGATDFNDLAHGQGHDAVRAVIERAQTHEENPMATATEEEATQETVSDSWPRLDELALRGVVGDLVRAIEPHTEADVPALLVQALTAFGSTLSRSAHFAVEADRHFMNLFGVLVGDTSKGRKGTSWGYVRRVFTAVDPDWASARILGGLSSGEGLIWAVRDEVSKDEPIREKGRPTGEYQTVVIDRGITDKRLLVLESEFANTLRVMERDGNTLSAVIRQAWDMGDLRTMTKNSPAQATGAHISIIAHVSKDELCRLIDGTDALNGFLNRFLWICTRRSKALPEGGRFDEDAMAPLVQRLRQAVLFGRGAGELKRDDEAREIWRAVYPSLSEGKPGLLGAVISRAEAQAMRLACLYALQDMSYVVRPDHLTAALALWEYCENSARYIFGQRLGDPIADELVSALKKHPHGMTRTDIRDWFGRNRRTHEIDRSLTLLARQSLARPEKNQSGGRPVERWFAVRGATTKTT
jgi:hypothetical protein